MFEIESMPSQKLCDIYGMMVFMYRKPKEHEPPHIHIKYAEKEAEYELNGNILAGKSVDYMDDLAEALLSKYYDVLLDMWKTQNIHPLGITENDLEI